MDDLERIFCFQKTIGQKTSMIPAIFLLRIVVYSCRPKHRAETQTVLPRFSAWEVDKSRKTNENGPFFCLCSFEGIILRPGGINRDFSELYRRFIVVNQHLWQSKSGFFTKTLPLSRYTAV
ncbi:MAG: hypothetical protein IJK56_04360 [Firmicutes bacterium]|nr:hypothetical protein [Bacillota bacterium]